MTARLRVILEAVGVVLVLIAGYGWYRGIQSSAVAKAREASADSVLAVLAKQRDSVIALRAVADTVWRHDTVTLEQRVAHYVTLHDTLNIHDTVQVTRFVAAADSMQHACVAVVSACDRRHRADSLYADTWEASANAWQAKYKAAAGQHPSAVGTVGRDLLIGLAGAGIHALLTRK